MLSWSRRQEKDARPMLRMKCLPTFRLLMFPATLHRGHVHDQAPVHGLEPQKQHRRKDSRGSNVRSRGRKKFAAENRRYTVMLSRTRFGAFLAVIMTLARRRGRRRRCHEQEDEPVQVGAEGFDAGGRGADRRGTVRGCWKAGAQELRCALIHAAREEAPDGPGRPGPRPLAAGQPAGVSGSRYSVTGPDALMTCWKATG